MQPLETPEVEKIGGIYPWNSHMLDTLDRSHGPPRETTVLERN